MVESGVTAQILVGAVSRRGAVPPVCAGYAAARAPGPPVTGVVLVDFAAYTPAAIWTGLASGLVARWTAGAQRSLSCSARSCSTSSPVVCYHRAPGRFMRTVTRLLYVASTLPLPIGRP